MIQFPFTPYAFIAVTALMFSIPATVYLIWLRPKSAATYNLIAFLLCIIGSFVAMFAFHARYWWVLPLWPTQDAFIIVGGFFMARFAYTFPAPERSREARWVVGLFGLLAIVTIGWLGLLFWEYQAAPLAWRPADAYWLLMPLTILLNVAVFVRRMSYFARRDLEPTTKVSFWSIVRHPPNHYARAHRTFALATLSGLIQAAASVDATSFAFDIDIYVPNESTIAIGSLLTISLILMAYLNATAHQNTLIVRLVGAPLIVLLAILGIVGIQVIQTVESEYWVELVEDSELMMAEIRAGTSVDALDHPEGFLYAATFPATNNVSAQQIDFLYYDDEAGAFDRTQLAAAIHDVSAFDYQVDIATVANFFEATRRTLHSRNRIYIIGAYQLNDGERITELGFAEHNRNSVSHRINQRLITQVIIGTLLVLLVLPVFFRRTLLVPLERLLHGVRRVNAGDMQTQVPVTVEDEFGFLTHSFNEMTASLHELNEDLERKVRDRTHELNLEIAQRQRTQVELEAAKEQAEKANRAKSVFLSQMSHELRTPLNAILGYTQIRQQQSPQDIKVQTAVIERSGRHLLTLINDMLDLAKIEAGKVELQPQRVAITPFLSELVAVSRSAARAKGVAIELETAIGADVALLVDEVRLRQVLLNLIGNGVKFTERGSVTLRVVELPHAGEIGRFHFAVQDSGIGIAPDQLPFIFDPLYQVPTSEQRSAGVGLGLAISQELVALMGGKLTVESVYGQGSTFAFTLPLPIVTRDQSAETSPDHPPYSRLLAGQTVRLIVVDDNTDNRHVLVAMLQPLGFKVEAFADGRSALEAISQSPPAAVITDLMMPAFDGFQLITALRGQSKTAELPIIATSASVFAVESERSIKLGANRFLVKPIELAQLLRMLDDLLELAWESAESSAQLRIQRQPAAETIARLHDAARLGSVSELRLLLAPLQQEPAYQQFVAGVHAYLNTYDLAELADWLAEYDDVEGWGI